MAISSAVSTRVITGRSGQPGNAMPLTMPNSSDVINLDYGIYAGYHRPINLVTVSSVARAIGSSMSGSLIYYQGLGATAGAAVRFTLPAPEPGLWFQFYGLGPVGSSAVTGYTFTGSTGGFAIGGDSACDAVLLSATTMDDESIIEFIAISTSKYLATFHSMSSIGSSVHQLDASS